MNNASAAIVLIVAIVIVIFLVSFLSNTNVPRTATSIAATTSTNPASSTPTTSVAATSSASTSSVPTTLATTASTSYASVNVTITAKDAQDPNQRAWEVFVDTYPGNYISPGTYTNQSTYTFKRFSGQSVNFTMNLQSGIHSIYLLINQTGGSSLGSYNGTVRLIGHYPVSGGTAQSNSSVAFWYIDSSHVVKMTYSPSTGLSQTTIVTLH